CCFFFQAEDGIRDFHVTGVQTCALPICSRRHTLQFGRISQIRKPLRRCVAGLLLQSKMTLFREILLISSISRNKEAVSNILRQSLCYNNLLRTDQSSTNRTRNKRPALCPSCGTNFTVTNAASFKYAFGIS